MPASRLGLVTRAFVSVLLLLARNHELVLSVTRDSSPAELLKAYKRLLLKVHPDKGGRKADAQKLNTAKENWDKARKTCPQQAGRPFAEQDGGTLACKQKRRNQRKEYRVNATMAGGRTPKCH